MQMVPRYVYKILTILMIIFYNMQPCSKIGYLDHRPKRIEKQPVSDMQDVKGVSPNRIVQNQNIYV